MGKKTKKSSRKPAAEPRAEVLVSLQEDEDHLAEVGGRVVVARLTQIAQDRLALAEVDEARLARFGFDAEWRRELAVELAKLADKHNEPVSIALAESGQTIEQSVARANAWLKRYTTVVKNSGPAVRKAAFKVTLHDRVPTKLASELEKLAGFVGEHAAETRRYGGGKEFGEEGSEIAQLLRKARATHGVERAGVSVSAREVHVLAGVVEGELVRLSRAAHDELGAERGGWYSLEELHPHHRHKRGEKGAGEGTGESKPQP